MYNMIVHIGENFSNDEDTFYCIYSENNFDIQKEECLSIHSAPGATARYVSLSHLREFVNELQEFYNSESVNSEEHAYEYTPQGVKERHGVPEECLICEEDVRAESAFLSIKPHLYEGDSASLNERIHRKCIPDFIDMITEEINSSRVFASSL